MRRRVRSGDSGIDRSLMSKPSDYVPGCGLGSLLRLRVFLSFLSCQSCHCLFAELGHCPCLFEAQDAIECVEMGWLAEHRYSLFRGYCISLVMILEKDRQYTIGIVLGLGADRPHFHHESVL